MGDIHADTRIKNSDKKVIGNHELEIKIHSFENNAESILNDEAMIYYLFRVDLKIAGFCALMLLNDEKNYVVDIGIYKKFRGKIGFHLGKMALEKFKREINDAKVFATIKDSNRASLFYTKSIGFKKIYHRNGIVCLGA